VRVIGAPSRHPSLVTRHLFTVTPSTLCNDASKHSQVRQNYSDTGPEQRIGTCVPASAGITTGRVARINRVTFRSDFNASDH
jgi:hypothetical protein